MSTAVFVNPFTDFGFKKIFGQEASLVSLKGFLNSLLPAHHQIKELSFSKNEALPREELESKAIFDLLCVSESGTTFLVELQKQKQNYFRDRSLYYSSFPIQEQAKRGDWNFKLHPVYCIGILDFCFDYAEDEEGQGDIIHTVQLKDQRNKVFNENLNFIYLEVPNFDKALGALENAQQRWLYFFKHLDELDEMPAEFMGEEAFEAAFESAALPKMSASEYAAYQQSLKTYRDLKNVIDTAVDEGWDEGHAVGHAEGLAEGLAEGEARGKAVALEETIQRLVSNGMTEEEARLLLGVE